MLAMMMPQPRNLRRTRESIPLGRRQEGLLWEREREREERGE
jgi:hypothetical protein